MDTFGRFSPISVDIFDDACGCFGFCFTRRVRIFTRHYCHRILGFFNEVEDDCKKGAVRMECLRDINRSFFCIFNLVEVVLGFVEVFAVLKVIFLFVFALFLFIDCVYVEVQVGIERFRGFSLILCC